MTAVILRFNRPALEVPFEQISDIQPDNDIMIKVTLKSGESFACYHIKIESAWS